MVSNPSNNFADSVRNQEISRAQALVCSIPLQALELEFPVIPLYEFTNDSDIINYLNAQSELMEWVVQ